MEGLNMEDDDTLYGAYIQNLARDGKLTPEMLGQYRIAPNVERAITDLCEIREAAAGMGDQGHDIACWADDALKALGYDR